MPEFLYKLAHEEAHIPGQISVEFDRTEVDLIAVWCEWLAEHGWPKPSTFTTYVGGSQEAFVWSPSDNHMMMHRLRWGGIMAQD